MFIEILIETLIDILIEIRIGIEILMSQYDAWLLFWAYSFLSLIVYNSMLLVIFFTPDKSSQSVDWLHIVAVSQGVFLLFPRFNHVQSLELIPP